MKGRGGGREGFRGGYEGEGERVHIDGWNTKGGG